MVVTGQKVGTLAAIALRKLARTAPEARDQCLPPSRENASLAAATAISTSSAMPAGMSPSPIPISGHHHNNKKVKFSTVLARLLQVRCQSDRREGQGGHEPMVASVAGLTTGRRRPRHGSLQAPPMKRPRRGTVCGGAMAMRWTGDERTEE